MHYFALGQLFWQKAIIQCKVLILDMDTAVEQVISWAQAIIAHRCFKEGKILQVSVSIGKQIIEQEEGK